MGHGNGKDLFSVRRPILLHAASVERGFLPPLVGLYLVIFRRYAWYFTVIQSKSVKAQSVTHVVHLCVLPRFILGLCVDLRTLRTEELSRDVEGFASHNNDLLSVEELLSHGTGQTSKEVTLAIDRDL